VVVSRQGRQIWSFTGIPYAKPPLGALRLLLTTWDGRRFFHMQLRNIYCLREPNKDWRMFFCPQFSLFVTSSTKSTNWHFHRSFRELSLCEKLNMIFAKIDLYAAEGNQ
jgi:hypothetical protein